MNNGNVSGVWVDLLVQDYDYDYLRRGIYGLCKYYVYDKEGKPTIEKIRILVDDNESFLEVYGKKEKNNRIEIGMEDILGKKLEQFPKSSSKDYYQKIVKEGKFLNKLYTKYQNKKSFTISELEFLFIDIDFYFTEGSNYNSLAMLYECDQRFGEIMVSLKNKIDDKDLILKVCLMNDYIFDDVINDIKYYITPKLQNDHDFWKQINDILYKKQIYKDQEKSNAVTKFKRMRKQIEK